MARPLAAVLFLILALLTNKIAVGQEISVSQCIGCHEDTYIKTSSYPYLHSVAMDKCPVCHIIDPALNETIKTMRFNIVQAETILYLGALPKGKKYTLEATAQDYSGRKSAVVAIDMIPDDAWEFPGKSSSINKISGVTLEEVKKAAFVQATVSWYTDAYATTEIEYKLTGKYPSRLGEEGIYSKKHKITLTALKHRKKYSFRAISADMNGNIMRSGEYDIDTSKGLTGPKKQISRDFPLPNIDYMRVFSIEGKKGFYMNVAANRPSTLLVSIKEKLEKKDEKHGFGLTSEKFLKIDVCYKCHPRDSSHPVGVKAEGPTLRTPKDLPTIEDGIITCVTCHKPHGGERLYYNRFDHRRDICVRCHIKGGAFI